MKCEKYYLEWDDEEEEWDIMLSTPDQFFDRMCVCSFKDKHVAQNILYLLGHIKDRYGD
jgi:hypothetical protein